MVGVKIAAATLLLRQPLPQALHIARRCGCEGVQIDARHELRPLDLTATALRQVRKLLDDLNLRVGSVRFPNRRGFGDSEGLQPRLEAAVAALRMADRLGARTLVCQLGAPLSVDDPQRPELDRALEILSAAGERYGVRIAFDADVADLDALARWIDGYPPEAIGLDLSPADLILHQRSPAEYVERFGPRIAHVRANDAVRGLGAPGLCVALGRGSADLPELMARLEQYDYRDWVTVEPRDAADPVAALDDAVALLRAL